MSITAVYSGPTTGPAVSNGLAAIAAVTSALRCLLDRSLHKPIPVRSVANRVTAARTRIG